MLTFPGLAKDCPVCRLAKDRQELIDRALEAEAENARLREALEVAEEASCNVNCGEQVFRCNICGTRTHFNSKATFHHATCPFAALTDTGKGE
jgi:hypothetical protein